MASRITFQPKAHRYALDGKHVPSVTTVIGNSTPKVGLRTWYAKEAARWAANNVDLLQTIDVDEWIRQAAGAPNSNRNRKATRGTSIHQYAHALLAGEDVDVPNELAASVTQVARFLDRWAVDEIASERPCANTELRYAGTFDLLANLRGEVWMLDYKSGDNLYPEHGLQLAAYAGCDIYQADEETDVPMPTVEQMGIVHLTDDGWNLVPVVADRGALFDYFRLMRHVSDYTTWTSGYPNPSWPVIGDPLPRPDLEAAS